MAKMTIVVEKDGEVKTFAVETPNAISGAMIDALLKTVKEELGVAPLQQPTTLIRGDAFGTVEEVEKQRVFPPYEKRSDKWPMDPPLRLLSGTVPNNETPFTIMYWSEKE